MALRLATLVAVVAICVAGCGEERGSSASSTTDMAIATTTTDCGGGLDTIRVPVLVITDRIPAGTSAEDAIADGLVVEKEIDAYYRPVTAVDSLADMVGGVAIADLEPNQVVVVNQWGLPQGAAVDEQPEPLC